MASKYGYLVLETGEVYRGLWHGGKERAGEVVFNTSHTGYEEMATDPSYYHQILLMTAPMQGNYGADGAVWESSQVSIHGFLCLELQHTKRDQQWRDKLLEAGVPILSEINTRELTIRLRTGGTPWGGLVQAESIESAKKKAFELIEKYKSVPGHWIDKVACQKARVIKGQSSQGPRVAVLDFGSKENILRELSQRCSEVCLFPSHVSNQEIRYWHPDGILLSNGPGDPALVPDEIVETIRSLLGWKFVFGICMGHQLLARALGAETYKIPYGHRGSNHPVRDLFLDRIYVTSQNHGYAVREESLSEGVEITHVNLNDNTIEGIRNLEKKCMSVQFHPESHPGPHDAANLFDQFIEQLR